MPLEDEPASPSARIMQEPGFNLCILTVMGYKTKIDADLFKKELEKTWTRHPRFSSVLVTKNKMLGKLSWKRVPVDMENHVFTPDLDPDMESPEQFIENFTSDLSRTPMDRSKPLWEIYILNVKTTEAESTVIFRIHHSVGDGVSMISLLMACAKKTSDPESLPVLISSKKQRQPKEKGYLMMIKRMFVLIWTAFLVLYNTLIDCVLFFATTFFLNDTRTLIKGGTGNAVSGKRFVHRIVSLDEVRLVRKAMNVSINDVVLGVTEAGLSRYLNTRYEKQRENGAETMKKKKSTTNSLPKKIYLRSAIVFNLRKSATIEDLAEMMEGRKELKGMWGNLVGIVLLSFTIAMEDDPLTYVRRAKSTMDGKKLSLAHKCSFLLMKLIIWLFGTKVAAAVSSAIFRRTTLTFSNVVGPEEEVIVWGHPLAYIAPSVHGFPQALIVHYQSYADKLVICVGADENIIPNPHQLCDDLVKSLENIKEAVVKKGLVEASQFR